jgi:glycosyltransferase involved in cell wall biosynthesis
MKRIRMLCGLFPEEIRKEIESKSIGPIQYAADALQWAIVKGLDEYTDLSLINLPYIGSYPDRYKDSKMASFEFSHKTGAKDYNVGFNNLALYKFYSRYLNAYKRLRNVVNSKNDVLIIYTIHTPLILAALRAKKNNPYLKICLVVPDLPEFMDDNQSFLKSILKRVEAKVLQKALLKIDAFVLLSVYMKEPLNVGLRPWVCVEGIYDQKADADLPGVSSSGKNIFYSGTLAARYGILNLLNAFDSIKDTTYNLWICGDGDTKAEIIARSEKDERIKFYGQMPREQVLALQKRATVLVNPRTSEGEFTKYSFPSKIMEYFASGVPSIMHKLPGIPEEYFQYCFIVTREDALGLKEKIVEVCEMQDEKLQSLGLAARQFILDYKSPKKQCGKIFKMINELC